METNTRQQKREYLLGKMYDGARALSDYFEKMHSDKTADARDYAENLKDKYQLTPNQQKYLDGVVERMANAKTIVQYLEKRFGVNKDGTFQDAQGLQDLLFKEDEIFSAKVRQAKSHNFGIGFVNDSWDTSLNKLAYKHNGIMEFGLLRQSVRDVISRLERGIVEEDSCESLTFRMPCDSRIAKYAKERQNKLNKASEEQKLYNAMFGFVGKIDKEGLKQELEEHELRHVIDAIISPPYLEVFSETQADLYSGRTASGGFERDTVRELRKAEEKVASSKNSLVEYQANNHPACIIEGQEKIIRRAKEILEGVKKRVARDFLEQKSTLISFQRNDPYEGLPYTEVRKAMSYLFSTMPPEKLFKRIKATDFSKIKTLNPHAYEEGSEEAVPIRERWEDRRHSFTGRRFRSF